MAELGRLIALYALVGFPFMLPYIYTYLTCQWGIMEVRNEDIKEYNAEVCYDAISQTRHPH